MPKIEIKYLLLFLIIILGIFLRFYRLSEFPVQLNHDEVTQLYDAISIAQTGKDIYGNFLPFIFYSVGDFKPPFYTYITSLFYFIFGGGELTIRLPAAIFGVLEIFAVYLFVLKLLRNFKIALSASFLTAIAPFEIFFSRKSFENGAGIFLMLIGFFCLLKYFEDKTKFKWFYLATVLFALTMYTYFSHAIILPLLLIVFLIIFRSQFAGFKKYLLPVFIFLVLTSPLILMTLFNPDTSFRSKTVFITQDPNLGRQIEYAQVDNPFLDKFLNLKTIFNYSFNRYLKQFDLQYLFGSGLDLTNQGPIGAGPLLFIQLPLLLAGIIYLVRLESFGKEKRFILAWLLLGMLPSGLTFETFSPHRVVMVFTMLNIISAVGLFWVTSKFGSLTQILLFLIIFFNLFYFIHIYFVNFPYEKSQYLHYPFKQVAQFAWSEYDNFDQIIFDPLFGEDAPVIGTAAHYYLAYFGGYPPVRFQKEYHRGDKERETIFDKFSIRKVNFGEDQNLKNVLIIASSWSLPIASIEKDKIMKIFYYYDGKVAFYAISLK